MLLCRVNKLNMLIRAVAGKPSSPELRFASNLKNI